MENKNNVVESILKVILKVSNAFLSILILFIFLFLFLQVLFRYVFHLPLYWVEELVKFMMIYVSTIGGGTALYHAGHPKIILFYDSLPHKIKPYYEIFLRLFILFFSLVFMVVGWNYALGNWWMSTSALEIPYFWPFLAMPLGGLVTFLILFLDSLDLIVFKKSYLSPELNQEVSS